MRLSKVGLVFVVIGGILANVGFVAFLGVAASVSGGGGAHDLLPIPVMMGFLVGGPMIFLLGAMLWLGTKIKATFVKAKERRDAAIDGCSSDSESPVDRHRKSTF